MDILNIGILAHVDAGKTSLTERLLFDTGAIAKLGSVDGGDTRTDSMELERRRGITIRSGVVSFPLDGRKVNLIDTPGHADFIAEVERALGVLDGAVLVVSAIDGVRARTRVLMRTLLRLRIPALLFVNKTDRPGTRYGALLDDIAARLTPGVLAVGGVPRESSVDDRAWLDDPELRDELRAQTRKCLVHPVFFGSALTGAGVRELLRGIRELLPATSGSGGRPTGTVFKIERTASGEKVAYARLFSGALGLRQPLTWYRWTGSGEVRAYRGKVTAIGVPENGATVRASRVVAGDIARLHGLAEIRIGDRLGDPGEPPGAEQFARPTLRTLVRARNPADAPKLAAALRDLAEQDPLIESRADDGELSALLYGEVQLQVLSSRLADEFGVDVDFADTRTRYLEKPVGTGESVHEIAKRGPNFHWATIGLRVEPGPVDSGIRYRLEVEPGSLPAAFRTAIEETVHRTLRRGPHGWEVTDCVVTLIRSGYAAPVSVAGDFRALTPIVLERALRAAGTRVYEPVSRYELELPSDTVSAVLAKLTELGATPGKAVVEPETGVLTGVLPAERVAELERALPKLARGEAVLLTQAAGFRPVTGRVPERR
ncbi:elongation factor G [Amycolatopsis anabasis]|uniref:elongation factor G n=1 Tax=Amycolatopsis anabasis TaxID=1840409 RepID=UPI00131C6F02|nr:TetM/TetW/TetO/TetS family tetracycline resistance ribosomal protection protein [Amycolatopsis anabasis]